MFQGAGNQADCLAKMPAIVKRILRARGYISGQGSGAEQNFPVDRSESRSEHRVGERGFTPEDIV